MCLAFSFQRSTLNDGEKHQNSHNKDLKEWNTEWEGWKWKNLRFFSEVFMALYILIWIFLHEQWMRFEPFISFGFYDCVFVRRPVTKWCSISIFISNNEYMPRIYERWACYNSRLDISIFTAQQMQNAFGVFNIR